MRILVLLIGLVIMQHHITMGQEKDSINYENKEWNRLEINLGVFFSGYNSGITFRSKQLGLGLVIDIEDALGLETSVFAFRGEGSYKFGKTRKSYITIGYFGINRSAKKVLVEKELEIGGIVYPVGSELRSNYNLSIIRLKYGYSFYQNDQVSIGASFGLFILPLSFSIRSDSHEDHNTNFTAPLPLIGLKTDFKISEKFYLKQNVEFLYVATSTFNGGILDLGVYLDYMAFKNVVIGLGMNSNRLNISIKKPDSNLDFFGDIRLEYTGLILYGRYYF